MTPMTLADLVAATGGDPLIEWAAQGLRPGVRAWVRADAAAVACPDLSCRDRMAVWGSLPAVTELLREALPQVGPTFRPIGDEALIAGLSDAVEQLAMVGRFAWMDVTAPVPASGHGHPHWLGDDAAGEVADLIDAAFPDSYARPGGAGVRRWAGIRDSDGTLLAVAADAWSVPEVGFLAGVATRPDARGRGLAASVCSFVTNELLATGGRVALLADYWNAAAVATYRRLGFALRPLGAARWR
jgi:ribosomal protein S18 acetylase RimI-like enzyme